MKRRKPGRAAIELYEVLWSTEETLKEAIAKFRGDRRQRDLVAKLKDALQVVTWERRKLRALMAMGIEPCEARA